MNQKLLFAVLTIIIGFSFASRCEAKGLKVDEKWVIAIDPESNELIKWAAQTLAKDIESILQHPITVDETATAPKQKAIIIGVNGSKIFNSKENEKLNKKWEHFSLKNEGKNIYVTGSDIRGTVYGIFELAERMGISPWIWWADVMPKHQKKISVSINEEEIEGPSVQYRGIFLNDEDWGLQPWAAKTFEPNTKDIGPKTYEKIFQLLLRLKANTIWPAMHPCTRAFYQIEGNNKMAQKYHIVVGTSHCEPMLRNNVDEWDHHTNGHYNYFTNKDGVTKYWKDRVVQVKDAENIVTLGMRGIHDGHMHGGNSLEEKAKMVEQIIEDQRQMLTDVKQKSLDSIASTIVLYKEVLDLYNKGLNVPDDVTIMWCDDNHGYIRRLSNKEEQKRKGGSGIYYHLSYWGSPHDYLWLSTTQPGLVWYEMNKAYQNGAQKIWIANVGDIKPAEYNMELFLDMAWDINSVSNDNIETHMQEWAEREFGSKVASDITNYMVEYYRLASIRRPEFMGWSRVEPRTKTVDTQFNPKANGNELQRRIDSYQQLANKVEALSNKIEANKLDAWFQLVEYPIVSAAAQNEKFLYAQLARNEKDSDKREIYINKSKKAYNKIEQLTKKYNHEIASGKWNHMMSMAPRKLNVFKLPSFEPNTKEKAPKATQKVTAIQANEFVKTTGNGKYEWKSIVTLGYSNNAVTLFPFDSQKFDSSKPTITYEFEAPKAGMFELQIKCLPTHTNDRNQIVTVQIDDQEAKEHLISTKGRSWQWKTNILQNHAIIKVKGKVAQKGKHTITLSVNQTGIVFDQLAIDFDNIGNYYEIPVSSK